ncbi:MAG TPA: mannose-1-phosphate guanylyltransferase [Syntrophales bacterium]|nr:mannose-1-phosphate guanylyltransferase [Syntrophales bacterium]
MHAVIMAGGRGSRFWPKSREKLPKHLLDLFGGRTIVQETVARVLPLVPPEKILIVTGESHAGALIRQLPELPRENILIEPAGRNTAPCIGWAAMEIARRDPGEVMLVLPSDQIILDAERFRSVLAAAADAAATGDVLVTIGIQPTGPETGYGYLECGEKAFDARGEEVFRVASIREKPDRATACEFLARGGFLWNSGMFVWRAGSILRAIGRWMPDLNDGLGRIAALPASAPSREEFRRIYEQLPAVSIDYGVMEKAGNVLVLRGDFGWSDVGSWDALWEISEKDACGNAASCRLVEVDAANVLVHGAKKLVALVGVKDLIVVETEDALLICRRGASQDVKKAVVEIERRGWKELL